jgi:hypothetical protein
VRRLRSPTPDAFRSVSPGFCSGVAANPFASVLSVTYRYRIPCLGERSTLIIRLIWLNINWLERVVDLFSMYGRVVGVKSKPFDNSVSPERLRCISSDIIEAVYENVDCDAESTARKTSLFSRQFANMMLFSDVRSFNEIE